MSEVLLTAAAWVVLVLAAWFVLSLGLALVIGKSVALADEREVHPEPADEPKRFAA